MTIAAKDFVLADENGVLCIPRARIREVLELAERIAEQERKLEAQVINNAVTSWDEI